MRHGSMISARLLAVLVLLSLSACLNSRTVHDLKVPTAASAASAQGPVVVVEAVDARAFQAKPADSDMPSLKNADEIGNNAITMRAYGRKRGSFGGAKGDFVLPEGRSVPLLVSEVVGKALTERGYTVVNAQDPRAASAAKLRVTIDQFWSYMRPGFFAVAVDFVARLRLEGDLVGGSQPLLVESKDELRKMMLNDGRWIGLVERGLGGLSTAVSEKLPPAGGVVAAGAESAPPAAAGSEVATGK